MDFAVEQKWRKIFMLAAEARAAKQREESFKLFYQDVDRREVHKHKAKEKEEEETRQYEQMIATTEQLTKFSETLDTYDTCTVRALMENRDALDRVEHAATKRLPGQLGEEALDGVQP